MQERRRGKNTLKRENNKIEGLTSGDWGGLGNYLWELTLERSNFAKRRRERATLYTLRGEPSGAAFPNSIQLYTLLVLMCT